MFLDNPFHLDQKTGAEEILIGTKYTAGIETETILLQNTSHLQNFKRTWDETVHLLRFENPLCSLTMDYFE